MRSSLRHVQRPITAAGNPQVSLGKGVSKLTWGLYSYVMDNVVMEQENNQIKKKEGRKGGYKADFRYQDIEGGGGSDWNM